MHTLRTFFKKEIAAEFLPAKSIKSSKVVIFCDGAPGVPSKRTLMEFFWKKGYWVFLPRYRGSWESRGVFLHVSPEQDIIDVIDALPRGFTDLWDKKHYRVEPKRIIIVGGSFGGPAVILASRDPRVTKAIAIAPVVDWTQMGPRETFEKFAQFMHEAFGTVYRGPLSNLRKLRTNTFYAPIQHMQDIDGSRIFIIQAKDDDSVRWKSVERFAKKTGAHFHLMKTGGHLSSSIILKPALWKKISKFLSS